MELIVLKCLKTSLQSFKSNGSRLQVINDINLTGSAILGEGMTFGFESKSAKSNLSRNNNISKLESIDFIDILLMFGFVI